MSSEISPPFKFLDPYTKADRDIFFGRDRETDELHSRLLASGLLLVYGVSGSGKTSLIQCGLANKFEAADCLVVTVRRGANLLASLDAELNRQTIAPPKAGASLGKRIRSLYLDHFKPIHLIFDQLEELFIFGDREERQAFGRALQELAALQPDVRLIFIVREEYLAAMTEFEPILPDLFRSRIRIEKLDRVEAREAIEGPCRRCGLEIEAGVVEEVLNRLAPAEATVELPWLQVVMDRFYRQALEQSPACPAFTHAGLATLDRFDNVLGRFLEEQVAALDQPLAGEAVLKALVSGDGTRRPLTLAAIAGSATVRALDLSGEALQALIQRLIAARILSDRDDHGHYELRHDSLARKVWEQMTAREKELLDIRQTIDIRFHDYQRRGLLLDADTLSYLAAYEDGLFLPPAQAAFVKASQEAAARQRKMRLTLAFSTLILVLLVVSGLGIFGYLQAVEARRQADEAGQQRIKAEQKAAEAERKEKEIRIAMNDKELALKEKEIARREAEDQEKLATVRLREIEYSRGMVFSEKARISLQDKDFNRAQLYSLHAIKEFGQQREYERLAVATHIFNQPYYPTALITKTAKQHDGAIVAIAFSPDGRQLASVATDKTIRVWDITTGKQITLFKALPNVPIAVAFAPDGMSLIAAYRDKTIRKWNLANGFEESAWRQEYVNLLGLNYSNNGPQITYTDQDGHFIFRELTGYQLDPVSAIMAQESQIKTALAKDGKQLWILMANGEISTWDSFTRNFTTLGKLPEYAVSVLSVAPDATHFLVGTTDGKMHLWSTQPFQELGIYQNSVGATMTTATFSPDGSYIAIGSNKGSIELWDQNQSDNVLGKPIAGHLGGIRSVALSNDGEVIASASEDGTIRLWRVADKASVGVLTGHTKRIRSIAFSPDGKWLVSGSADNTVRIWDLLRKKEVASGKHGDGVLSVAFSGSGRIASGSWDKKIKLWNIRKKDEAIYELQQESEMQVNSSITSISFSPDSKVITAGAIDSRIYMWYVDQGKNLKVLDTELNDYVLTIAFSPDGKTLAAGSLDHQVILLDATTGKRKGSILEGHQDNVYSVTFSNDGKLLASASRDGIICLWDTETFEKKAILKRSDSAVRSIVFSPSNQNLFAGSSDGMVHVWNISHVMKESQRQGQVVGQHERSAYFIDSSIDGALVVTGGEGGEVKFWDLRKKDKISSFLISPFNNKYQKNSAVVALSDNGNQVAFSIGRTISLGLMQKNENELSLNQVVPIQKQDGKPPHSDQIASLSFSPDGKILFSGGWDSAIRIWAVDTNRIDVQLLKTVMMPSPVMQIICHENNGDAFIRLRNSTIWRISLGTGEKSQIDLQTDEATEIRHFGLSPSGKFLVLGYSEGQIQVHDLSSGTSMVISESYTGEVLGISFLDEKRIVIAYSDQKIRIWDIDSASELGILAGHKGRVEGLIYSSATGSIVSVSRDRMIRILDIAALLSEAKVDNIDARIAEAEKIFGLRMDGVDLVPMDYERVLRQ